MTLPALVEAAIVAHAWHDAPAECCGLLLGRGDEVVDAVRTRNQAIDPRRRYLVDPQEHFQTIREARRRALEVIGVYHSHPRSSAVPSATDQAEAFTHFIFLIVGLQPQPPQIAAWTWVDGNFNSVPIVRSS